MGAAVSGFAKPMLTSGFRPVLFVRPVFGNQQLNEPKTMVSFFGEGFRFLETQPNKNGGCFFVGVFFGHGHWASEQL